MKVEIQLETDQIQNILEGILGANFESFTWYESVKYDENYEWNIHPKDINQKFVTVEIISPEHYEVYLDEDEEVKTIAKSLSVCEIIESWSKCSALGYDVTTEDAPCADNIIQMAVLGKAVYG